MKPRDDPDVQRFLDGARKDPAILAVILFGSYARGETLPSSDVDLCLVLEPERDTRETRIRVRLDHLPGGRLDVRIFQQLPLYVRHRVLKDGVILFCRDLDTLYELAYRTVKAFADFRPSYQQYLEQIASARS